VLLKIAQVSNELLRQLRMTTVFIDGQQFHLDKDGERGEQARFIERMILEGSRQESFDGFARSTQNILEKLEEGIPLTQPENDDLKILIAIGHHLRSIRPRDAREYLQRHIAPMRTFREDLTPQAKKVLDKMQDRAGVSDQSNLLIEARNRVLNLIERFFQEGHLTRNEFSLVMRSYRTFLERNRLFFNVILTYETSDGRLLYQTVPMGQLKRSIEQIEAERGKVVYLDPLLNNAWMAIGFHPGDLSRFNSVKQRQSRDYRTME